MSVLVVTGTGTDVGKTVVTAAVAALAGHAGRRVAVVKAAQTGVPAGAPGDAQAVRRLAPHTTVAEGARFPDPLAPATAARRAHLPAVDLAAVAELVRAHDDTHDLVLVEGAGGLLVRYDDDNRTIADLAASLHAPVLLVVRAGLGTLNDTALTVEALAHRGLTLDGVVIGSWPARPDLADRCNLDDLARLTGRPVDGALPAGAGTLPPGEFVAVAAGGLGPRYGGRFDPEALSATAAATSGSG